MAISNKKAGSIYEQKVCEIFEKYGFWAHNFANKTNGQPCDIIVSKNKHSWLMDAKICEDGKFDKRRIEDNQRMAMTKWEECGNNPGLFVWLLKPLPENDAPLDWYIEHSRVIPFRMLDNGKGQTINVSNIGWSLSNFILISEKNV